MELAQNNNGFQQWCLIHKKHDFVSASLIIDDPIPFLCRQCVSDKSKKITPQILIEDILKSNQENEPILNWPPGIPDGDVQFLMNNQSDSIKKKLEQGIMEFYENLSKQINVAILESKKEQLSQLNNNFDSINLINQYNELFKRKELVSIFKNYSQQSKDQYLKLLHSINATLKKDLEILQQSIKEKKQEQMKVRKFQNNSIKALKKKLNTILSDLSPSLFQSDKEDIIEKYDFKIKIEEEDDSQNPNNFDMKPSSQARKQLFNVTESQIKTSLCSNSLTLVHNPNKQKGYCYSSKLMKEDSIINFKITFMDRISFENFAFGLLMSNDSNEHFRLYNNFWKQVKQKISEKKIEDELLEFQFMIDVKKKELKLGQEFLRDKFTLSLQELKPQQENRVLFFLSNDCSQFYIDEFY